LLAPLASIIEISQSLSLRHTQQRGPFHARGRVFPGFPGTVTSSDSGGITGSLIGSDKISAH
jgi:hypothetical protein